METRTFKFKKALLSAFAIITAPSGKIGLEVLNNVSEANLVFDEQGRGRYIVSLKAIAQDKLAQLKEVFKNSEEVELEETNGLFLTANIWKKANGPTQLPMRGETIDCIVGYVPDRTQQQVLRVISCSVRPAEVAKTLDLETFFAAEEAPAVQTQGNLVHS